MLNGQNYSLEEVLKLINSHKIKSNSLKNYFLRNINNNEITSEILGYLGELEYDLETINKLIRNFHVNYCNMIESKIKDLSMKECYYNNEINRLNNELNKAVAEINNLKNENNFLKNKEINIFKLDNKENNKNLNKTFNVSNNFNNCENNKCGIAYNYKSNKYNPYNNFDNKIYGRLTYSRSSNESNNFQKDKNNIKNGSNISYSNKTINNSKKHNVRNENSDNNINKTKNKDIINLINNINHNNNNSCFNSKEKDSINNNLNQFGNQNDNNINNYKSDNISSNNGINNNINIGMNSNESNNIFENINPIERKNYSSYKLSIPSNSIMNSKRIIPKYHYQNRIFKQKIFDVQREKDDKISRINNILSVISNDKKKLNEIKSIFGYNIEAQLLNGDINYNYLDKIENYLYIKRRNESIIPLSKRFQIQSRAKSNSVRKSKKLLNNNINNRLIKKKRNDIKNM